MPCRGLLAISQREDGKLMATTSFGQTLPDNGKNAAERSKEYVQRHWKYHESDDSPVRSSGHAGSVDFVEQFQSHSLCISGMAFQDAWNIDLERLRRCCIHVATKDRKLIPFCAYYLTDAKGHRLIEQSPMNPMAHPETHENIRSQKSGVRSQKLKE